MYFPPTSETIVRVMELNHLSDQKIFEVIGARFKSARLNKNLSASKLADMTGLTSKTIANLENGRKSVGLLNVIAIIRALEMLEELDSFIPEPPPRAAGVVRRKKFRGVMRQRASRQNKNKITDDCLPWKWESE